MIYQSLGDGRLPSLEPVQPYGKYIKWLMKQDRKEAEIFGKRDLPILSKRRLFRKIRGTKRRT